jgi:hypothetical protein
MDPNAALKRLVQLSEQLIDEPSPRVRLPQRNMRKLAQCASALATIEVRARMLKELTK